MHIKCFLRQFQFTICFFAMILPIACDRASESAKVSEVNVRKGDEDFAYIVYNEGAQTFFVYCDLTQLDTPKVDRKDCPREKNPFKVMPATEFKKSLTHAIGYEDHTILERQLARKSNDLNLLKAEQELAASKGGMQPLVKPRPYEIELETDAIEPPNSVYFRELKSGDTSFRVISVKGNLIYDLKRNSYLLKTTEKTYEIHNIYALSDYLLRNGKWQDLKKLAEEGKENPTSFDIYAREVLELNEEVKKLAQKTKIMKAKKNQIDEINLALDKTLTVGQSDFKKGHVKSYLYPDEEANLISTAFANIAWENGIPVLALSKLSQKYYQQMEKYKFQILTEGKSMTLKNAVKGCQDLGGALPSGEQLKNFLALHHVKRQQKDFTCFDLVALKAAEDLWTSTTQLKQSLNSWTDDSETNAPTVERNEKLKAGVLDPSLLEVVLYSAKFCKLQEPTFQAPVDNWRSNKATAKSAICILPKNDDPQELKTQREISSAILGFTQCAASAGVQPKLGVIKTYTMTMSAIGQTEEDAKNKLKELFDGIANEKNYSRGDLAPICKSALGN